MTINDIKIKKDECTISTFELIELLEFKLDTLKQAEANDSSWNYDIEELKTLILNLRISLITY
jgi:hypothetical protein